jgi:hypothetical protein
LHAAGLSGKRLLMLWNALPDIDAVAKQVAVIPLWQNGHRQQNSD